MINFNEYILEKFKITKDIKLISNSQKVLSFFKNSKEAKINNEFISHIEKWLDENKFTNFDIYGRNFHYLGTLDNSEDNSGNELIMHKSREELTEKFNEYFNKQFNRYKVYVESGNNYKDIYINRNALYFTIYCDNKDEKDNWVEGLIIGK